MRRHGGLSLWLVQLRVRLVGKDVPGASLSTAGYHICVAEHRLWNPSCNMCCVLCVRHNAPHIA